MKIERLVWSGIVALMAGACSAQPEREEGGGASHPIPPEYPRNDAPYAEPQVTVVSGAPTGSDVVFHDAAGEVVAWVHNDGDHPTQSLLPENGMVTVARSEDGGRVLEIVTGLAPGMDVAFDAEVVAEQGPIGSIRAVTPGPFTGSAYYSFESGCWSAASTVAPETVSLEVHAPECDPSNLALVGFALDGEGKPLAYTFLTGLVLPSSPGFASPSAPATATLDVVLGPWKTDFVASDVLVREVPAGFGLQLSAWSWHGAGRFGFVGTGGTDGGDRTLTLLQPPGFADGVGYRVLVYREATGSMLEGRTGVPSSIVVNCADDLLPVPEAAGLDLSDPARPAVTTEGDLSGAEALVLDLWWEDSATGGWLGSTLLAPAVGATLRHPALPPELQPPSSLLFAGAWLTTIDPPGAAGYQGIAGPFFTGPRTLTGDSVERTAWTSVGL